MQMMQEPRESYGESLCPFDRNFPLFNYVQLMTPFVEIRTRFEKLSN
jgi:hypothetical protein